MLTLISNRYNPKERRNITITRIAIDLGPEDYLPRLRELYLTDKVLTNKELKECGDIGDWTRLEKICLRDYHMLPGLLGCEATLRLITLVRIPSDKTAVLVASLRFGALETLTVAGVSIQLPLEEFPKLGVDEASFERELQRTQANCERELQRTQHQKNVKHDAQKDCEAEEKARSHWNTMPPSILNDQIDVYNFEMIIKDYTSPRTLEHVIHETAKEKDGEGLIAYTAY